MENRTGEKLGWQLGFMGGCLWILVFSIMWFVKSDFTPAIITLGFFLISIYFILKITPWNFPETRYWILMLPYYALNILAIVYISCQYGVFRGNNLSFLYLLPLLSIFGPFITIGFRKWNDE